MLTEQLPANKDRVPASINMEPLQENNMTIQSSSFDFELDSSTRENVTQSWKDDKTTFRFNIVKLILAAIVTIGYFLYALNDYLDPVTNSITRSSVDKISEVDLPLFYFYAGLKLSNLDVSYVRNGGKVSNYQDLIVVNADDFQYDTDVDEWTLVRFGSQGI